MGNKRNKRTAKKCSRRELQKHMIDVIKARKRRQQSEQIDGNSENQDSISNHCQPETSIPVTKRVKKVNEEEASEEQANINNNENNAAGMETDDIEANIQTVYCKAEPEERDCNIETEEHEENSETEDVLEVHDTDTLQIPSTSFPNSTSFFADPLESEERESSGIDDEGDSEKEAFFNLCDSHLTKEFAEVVKAQTKHLDLSNTDSLLHKNHQNFIMFCWNLYLTSPKVYFVFQNFLGLPSPDVLKVAMPITSMIDQNVMSVLESKVKNMTELEKNCALVMYTVDLKAELFYNIKEDRIIGFHEVDGVQTTAAAKNALVIALRGIFIDWKQPISYALLSQHTNINRIDDWINNVLIKLVEIGLNVRTFVTDFKTEYYDVAKMREVTIDKPYFIIKVKLIYYIYDAAHLIKEIHDNFIEHDYHMEGQVANYKHVVTFYKKDKKKSFKIAPKLTDDHIKPSELKKNNAILATQVLSGEVATGISMYVDCNLITKEAKDTVEFIKQIKNLHEALNCSSHEDYEHRRPFLDGMLSFFQTLKIINPKTGIDVTSSVSFIDNFQTTIMSVLLLLDDLKLEEITCLPTKRLNLGNENEKTKNGKTPQPTPKQFVSAFQKGFFTNVMKPTQKSCDIAKVIASLRKLELLNMPNDNQSSDEDEDSTIEIASYHYNKLDPAMIDSIVFMSGFLLRKCLEHHKDCAILNAYAKGAANHDYRGNDRYRRYQNYAKETKSDLLIVPCDDFVNYIQILETAFRDSFEWQHINRKIALSIYNELKDIRMTPPPCPCFPMLFMKKLLISMRIFFTMKLMTKHVISFSISINKTR